MGHKALVLCAGFGTRMGPLTQHCPKPMLPFKFGSETKPMLQLTLNNLKRCGVDQVAINLHYLPDQITQYFSQHPQAGLQLKFSYEDQPLGTAGAVKLLADYFQGAENFFVIYGDILSDLDYDKLMDFHLKHGQTASIVLHQRQHSNSYVQFDERQKITSFIERPEQAPAEAGASQYWVNSAIYCFRKEILSYIPKLGYCDFPKHIFPKLVEQGSLYGFPLAGAYRIAIDSEARYLKAQSDIDEHKINWRAISCK